MTTEHVERAAAYARGVVSGLTDDDLGRATPCAGWDVGTVVLHLADVSDAVTTLLQTGTLALPQARHTHDPDPVALMEARLVRLTDAFADSCDETRIQEAVTAAAIELTTHGWDIGVSRHPDHLVPEGLAADVLSLVSPVLDSNARGENFAAPIDVAGSASASDRLIAFLGRAPRR